MTPQRVVELLNSLLETAGEDGHLHAVTLADGVHAEAFTCIKETVISLIRTDAERIEVSAYAVAERVGDCIDLWDYDTPLSLEEGIVVDRTVELLERLHSGVPVEWALAHLQSQR